ncbi:MAG: outer membrane protein transport protein [Pseudomonadota bacterium]
MKKILTSVSATCLLAGAAHAGALDRTGQSVDVLFEEGRYIEFSLGSVSPDISGNSVSVLPNGSGSGDISPSSVNFGAAYKADINDQWSYAFILEEPFKAEVDYPDGTGYFAEGSNAEFNSIALTGLLQYNMQNGFSVFGGLRLQRTDANAGIAFVGGGYEVKAEQDWGVGYVAGVAYERPDIALRVSLTYSSEIAHENDVSETFAGAPFLDADSTAEFETPQSVNLAFQTGIAADTLLFGGIRWVDWSDFDLSPNVYSSSTVTGSPLLSYEEDVTTYTLGLGRRLSDQWSVAASVGYEENTGALFTNLGPADGQTSLGLAAIYTHGNMRVTTGVRYIWIGDTETRVGSLEPGAEFKDNDAVAFGVKVGYNF